MTKKYVPFTKEERAPMREHVAFTVCFGTKEALNACNQMARYEATVCQVEAEKEEIEESW